LCLQQQTPLNCGGLVVTKDLILTNTTNKGDNMEAKRILTREYYNHKANWWKVVRYYQLIILHIFGASAVLTTLIAVVNVIKYFLGF
tara:strand:- start:460 stop:720 length:261 start_codon:yes stop_codon:yes gene_type:complete